MLLKPTGLRSRDLFNETYNMPITAKTVEIILRINRPDSILLSFGDEQAFNCAFELYETGILDKYSCNVLG